MKMPPYLNRTIILVSMISLFTDIASEMLYPVMPLYLTSIGFSMVLIGVLEGFAEATAGFSKGFFGQYSDRLGKRALFIQWGYSLSAVSKPLMALFSYPWWVFFARTTDRLGKGVRTSARDALLSDESSPENKGKVFGFHRGMDTLGAAVGPAIALLFLTVFPGKYRMLFFLAFLPGLAAVLITSFIKDKKRTLTVEYGRRVHFFSFLSYWKRSSSSYKKLIAGLLFFALFNSSDVFLLLRTKLVLGSDRQMILFYVFYNLVYALAAFPLGKLADKVGLRRLLAVGLLLFAVVYSGMGFVSGILGFLVLFLLYAIYAASTEGISKALISNIAEKEETATALGFYNSLLSLVTLAASSMAGVIWYLFSPKAMFLVSASGALLAGAYLIFVHLGNKSRDTGFSTC